MTKVDDAVGIHVGGRDLIDDNEDYDDYDCDNDDNGKYDDDHVGIHVGGSNLSHKCNH